MGRIVNLATCLAAFQLSACQGTPAPIVGPVASSADPALGQAHFSSREAAEYRLRPADVVAINVFREPDLSLASAVVGADGNLAVPLIGSVKAEGLTTSELSNTIEEELTGGYLLDPKVSINVVQYNSNRVTVEGAVKQPGLFTFVPGTRLSSAVALAQGPTRVANLNQLVVFRNTPEGVTVAKFNYRAMQQGTMMDPVLQPGDRVVMGTSGNSQAFQDLLQAIPVFALFTRL